MNRIVKKLIIVIIFSIFSGSQAWALSLSFNPFSSLIGIGEAVDIGIVISDLGNEDLAAFDINIHYDNAILGFNTFTLGDNLGDIAAGDAVDLSLGDNGAGIINLAELSLLWDLSSQPDTFMLATISFIGNGSGISPLVFSNVILSDFWGDPLTATTESVSISVSAGGVSPVPEPTTMMLLATGLAGMFGLSRKKVSGCH